MMKLYIFDYDGLLVNSEHVVYRALADLFSTYDRTLSWNYYCEYIGTPVSVALAEFHREHSLPVSLDDFMLAREEWVERYKEKHLTLIEGAKPFLDYALQRSLVLAIASSGTRNHVLGGLERFGIRSYFSAIATIEDVERGKPHPDLINKVLGLTGIPADEAVLFEDAPSGIEAAKRAGVMSVLIPTKGAPHDDFDKASLIAKDFPTLLRIFS